MKSNSDLRLQPAFMAPFLAKGWGNWLIKIIQWGILLILCVIIARRLSELGWDKIWVSRPANLGFYLLLLLQYLLQPLADLVVYRTLWGRAHMPPFSIILRKRFLNSVMLDYSGEIFFFFWAQKRVGLPASVLVHTIKDSNVLSAGAGLVMVWLVGLLLIFGGGLQIPKMLGDHTWLYLLLGSLPFLFCAILVLAHRKVSILTRGQMARTFAIHFVRAVLALAVEFWLWELSGALPSWISCLEFVGLRLVLTRLPLVSNKDLLFVGAGIAAAGMAKLPVAPIATVLVILTAADLILSSSLAGFPWVLEQLTGKRRSDEASA